VQQWLLIIIKSIGNVFEVKVSEHSPEARSGRWKRWWRRRWQRLQSFFTDF